MSSPSTLTAQNYHLKWDSHLSNLNLSLTSLFKTEKFADVMLLSSHPDSIGGPAIPAHKIILSSCSHFFSTIFTNQLAQNPLMYIMLPPELSYRCIKTLVQYMYSGESTVSNDILNEVLRGGEILKIRGLCKSRSRGTSQRSYTPNDVNQIGKSPLHQSPFPSLPKDSPVILKLPNKQAQKITTSSSCTLPLPIIEKNLISIKKDIAIDPECSGNNNVGLLQTAISNTQNCCLPPPPMNSNIIKEEHVTNDISIEKDASEESPANNRLESKEKSQQKNCEPSTSGISTTIKRKILVINNNETTPNVDGKKNDDINNSNSKNKNLIESEKLDNLSITIEKKSIKEEKDLIEVIKEEPIDWHQSNSENSCSSNSQQVVAKPPPPKLVEKIKIERFDDDVGNISDGDQGNDDYEIYELDDDNDTDHFAPLECETCNEKFSLPKDWVRHIETHMETDVPKKKQKLIKKLTKETDVDYIVALKCDLCSTFYDSPAEWVRHIENEHTEKELAAVNSTHDGTSIANKNYEGSKKKYVDYLNKSCDICGEIFPTYAKKIIHYRTHTKKNT